MKIHILGICGSFMGGVALLAKELGHQVSGSDANVYPPMSTMLEDNNIHLHEGYDTIPLKQELDMIVIGNTLSRGNEAVEYILNNGLPYISGPQWLAENLLHERHVIAISGTHGKTSTTSMLAWVLEFAAKSPGFLIGGIAENFGVSARCGTSDYFIVEADEYDTAFFDKRSKFIHYRPRTLIINNIEFDHADIFGEIGDIIREFRRMIRIVPGTGTIIIKADDPNIEAVLEDQCWTSIVRFGENSKEWDYQGISNDLSHFDITYAGQNVCRVKWEIIGRHNVENALAVCAAAHEIGIDPKVTADALCSYKSVKRRLQKLAVVNGITIYDDFAHHPTAISTTISALRSNVDDNRIIAVFEPRSNTMKMGIHQDTIGRAFNSADKIFIFKPDCINWDMDLAFEELQDRYGIFTDINQIIETVADVVQAGDHVVIMSNGGFGGIHQKIINKIEQRPSKNLSHN